MFTIQLFPSTFMILFLIVFLITFLIYRKKGKNQIKLFFIGMFEIYILLVFSVAILPIRFISPDLREGEIAVKNFFQWIPFRSIYTTLIKESIFSVQLIGNIVLFFPFPIFLGYLKMNSKKYGMLFLQSFSVSILIEILQVTIDFALGYPSRKFDVDDIILNAVGILLGLFIYFMIQRVRCVNAWIGKNLVYRGDGR